MGADRFHWDLVSDADNCPAQLAAANAKIVELEHELQQLRAAKAADREHIVGEVIHHALRAMRDRDGDRRINDTERADRCVLVAEIARRVADALAAPQRPVLSEEERCHLLSIKSQLSYSRRLWSAELATLDRLLAP